MFGLEKHSKSPGAPAPPVCPQLEAQPYGARGFLPFPWHQGQWVLGPHKGHGCVPSIGLWGDILFFLTGSYSTSRPPILKIWPILPAEEMIPVKISCLGLSWTACHSVAKGGPFVSKLQTPSVGPLASNSASDPYEPEGSPGKLNIRPCPGFPTRVPFLWLCPTF